jgi:hypothetical protein
MSRIANATTEPEEHEEIEVTPEMVDAGMRFLEDRGVSTEFAYPEFVGEFLMSAIRGGRFRKARANEPAS